MGDDYVVGSHTIEDPTFDATAIATNLRVQVRCPIHQRRPRRPTGIRIRVDRHHRRVPSQAEGSLERWTRSVKPAAPGIRQRRCLTTAGGLSGPLVSGLLTGVLGVFGTGDGR